MPDFQISFDLSRLDFETTSKLLRDSYWGRERTDALNRKAFANSICAMAFDGESQIGFARASGDRAVFARLSDVIVWPDYRGRGIGRALVKALLEHPDLATVSVWTLNTSDAHALYEPFGFRLVEPGCEMRFDREIKAA